MIKRIKISLPFTSLTLNNNDICAIVARPSMGKTLYAMNIIKHNSWVGRKKCLAYFVGNNKKPVYKFDLYNEFSKDDIINMFKMSYGREDAFIFDLKRDVNEFKPEYVVIDGFEKLFKQYESNLKLLPEVDLLLSDLRMLSDEKNIPIILTTHVLSTAEFRISPPKPMLCDLGSNTLESTVDKILSLNSLFYYGYGVDSKGYDISSVMELHQLKPWNYEIEQYNFTFDKETGNFIP